MRPVAFMVLGFVLPATAGASELDDIHGWRATRTVEVAAAPEFVIAHTSDFEQWSDWAIWRVRAKLGCAGSPGRPQRECTWTASDGSSLTMTLTAIDDGALHYDYVFGDNALANKAILSWTASGAGTTVTWDTAGTARSVPKALRKTASDALGKDLESGLTKLKVAAEADAKQAAEAVFAAADKKAAGLEAAAKTADEESKIENAVWRSAVAASDAATAAVAAANNKPKARLEAAAAEAKKSADAAWVTADAAATKAVEARKLADAARAEATALAPKAP